MSNLVGTIFSFGPDAFGLILVVTILVAGLGVPLMFAVFWVLRKVERDNRKK